MACVRGRLLARCLPAAATCAWAVGFVFLEVVDVAATAGASRRVGRTQRLYGRAELGVCDDPFVCFADELRFGGLGRDFRGG
jgi:hypothetical protein